MPTLTGIQRGAIIKASDIYSRYSGIIGDLLTKAKINYDALTVQIAQFKSDITVGTSAETVFKNLQTSSYHEITSEFVSISSRLAALQTQWFNADDPHNLDNSAHGGIQEYKTDFTDHESRKKNPLHVIKHIGLNDNRYPADGRVNQSDFIGAYHFQNTIESLYAIATRLRDIQIKIDRSRSDKKINLGIEKNPIADLSTITNTVNCITESKIDLSKCDPPLSVCIMSFHDWILNNTLNGNKIAVGDDTIAQNRGWVTSTSSEPKRYPTLPSTEDLTNAMKYSEYFINRNVIGRQITRNLRDRRNEVSSGGTDERAMLSNFYYNDQTNDKYGRSAKSGIAKEYLTLKFGTDISADPTIGFYEISSYSTPLNELNNYFYRNVQESYPNDHTILNNVIRSKTTGYKHIVCAQTVNDMFKQMNLMLVQISASLYGKYVYSFDEGEITNYGSGNPRGGLGYPEVMSWYSGGTHNGDIDFLNRGKIYSSLGTHKETYNGTLGSRSYVANEKYNKWKSIRCGYPWMSYDWRISSNVTSLSQIYDETTGSTVPMSFNGDGLSGPVDPPGSVNSVKVDNLVANEKESSYFYGTSSNGTYVIENAINGDAHRQVFTRYCISHPVELSAEKNITSNVIYGNSNIKNVDINAKYLFMPYMMYFDDWYSGNKGSIQTGSFLGRNITVQKDADIFKEECGMPVQLANRNEIWNAGKMAANQYSNISVGLVAGPDISGNYYVIGEDYKIEEIHYNIKGINTVNEVNHTHTGYSRLKLSVDNSSVISNEGNELEIPYKGGDDSMGSYSATVSGISSIVYFGKNDYDSKGTQFSTHLSTFYADATDAILYDRYRFNDFYDDYDLFVKEKLSIDDVKKYFSCGGNNLYLGGNKTMFWNWYLKKPLPTGSTTLKLYPYFKNKERDKYKGTCMIQGNFYFSANHSDIMKFSSRNTQKPIKITGERHYSYIPIPDKVSITSFEANSDLLENNVIMKGWCHAWWNNLAKTYLTIDFNPLNPGHSISTFMASAEYNPTSTSYPSAKNRPFTASQVVPNANLTGSGISVVSQWNSNNNRFDFTISCSCSFPSSYVAGDNLLLSYGFTNEDGGRRIYSGQQVSPMVSPNFSKSYSWIVPYGIHKVSTNVKIGNFVSSSSIPSLSSAINTINKTSLNTGVSILTTSLLGWGQLANGGRYDITNSNDFSIINGSNPIYGGCGGWVGLKTKVTIPTSAATNLVNGQSIAMNVKFGPIIGGSGDGVAIFFGDENTEVKNISAFENDKTIVGLRQHPRSGTTNDWTQYADNEYNKSVVYSMISTHFDNIGTVNQSNVLSKGGKISINTNNGAVPQDALISFNKVFKVHKNTSECYIINKMFINFGGDSYTGLTNIDWGVFGVQINPIR